MLIIGAFLVGLTGPAQATLVTIGTAEYLGSDYNLIWDDDNNGNSVIWLDYTGPIKTWTTQTAWAAGLDSNLTYNFVGYTVIWDDPAWRLPSTVDGPFVVGYDGTTTGGFNITSSEMGHLYYEELGNLGYYDTSGIYAGDGNWGLLNTGDFDNLNSSYRWYWSGTEYTSGGGAWHFYLQSGNQATTSKGSGGYGLAVRSGQVSAAPVPGPTIDDILDFFDDSVADGTLTGDGPGNSANGRLYALRNMLEMASDLIDIYDIEGACLQLNAVIGKCDGYLRPKDFVTGEAVTELYNMILELMEKLECE